MRGGEFQGFAVQQAGHLGGFFPMADPELQFKSAIHVKGARASEDWRL
jgi:hypothetical protein